MSNLLFKFKSLLNYLIFAKTKYYMHSPFVYDLMAHVLEKKTKDIVLDDILKYRETLKSKTSEELVFEGIGAISITQKKSVAEIEKVLSIPHRYGKRFYNIIQKYDYKNILEMGTCIGLGTLYLAKASKDTHIFTIEGNKDCCNKALNVFKENRCDNITLIQGLFEDQLLNTLKLMPSVDMVVIDGNHQYQHTLNYFKQILPYIHENSLIVIDDIYWSKGMFQAWQEITQNPSVSLSLDFYRNGFVFFRKDRLQKENFKLLVHD